jgi:energy-coupling factor transporter ATP-binding protein EcfA2
MDYLVILQADGASILLITHDFKLVHRYAQRVVLMKEGRITLQGKTNGHLPTMKSTGSRRLPKPKAVSSAMRSLGGSR